MATEKEQILSNLRACVVSSQGGVLAAELNKDYKCLVGEHIPFKRLGYSTLEDFLTEIPNVQVSKKNGEWWVQARMDGASSHILKLVQGQNKSKSKKPKRKPNFTPRSFAPVRHVPTTSQSQVPHFMQTKKTFNPLPKSKTMHIPSVARGTASLVKNNDEALKSMPVVVNQPKAATFATASKPEEPPPKAPIGRFDGPVPIRLRNPRAENSTKECPSPRPALLTTPTGPRLSGPVLPTPSQPQAVPFRPPFVPDSNFLPPHPNHVKPPLRTTSRLPLANPLLDPSRKPSVSDRLLAYKNKNEGSTQNGTSAGQRTTDTSAVDSVQVKFVNPISYYGKKNSFHTEPTKNLVNLPVYASDDDSSYVLKLTRYAASQKWSQPEFFVLPRVERNGRTKTFKYLSRVCVNCTPDGSETFRHREKPMIEFSCYPEEFDDPNLAMNSVAKKAYDELVKTTVIKLPETKDHAVIFRRLNEMIIGKPQGVWLFQIKKEYMELYKEALPSNLPELLENECPTVEVTKLAESYFVVRPKLQAPPRLPAKNQNNLIVERVHLPESEQWDVFVSKVKSFNEVYIRLIGECSNQFEAMCDEMDDYYMPDGGEIPESIELGGYYAYLSESAWRCLVTGHVDGEYQIYLIDIGDVEFVEASAIRVLLPKFHELRSQALPCFLDMLDNFDFALSDSTAELSNKVVNIVSGKSFAAVATCVDPIRLYLFDTESDEDVNINQCIRDLIVRNLTDPAVAFQQIGLVETVNVPCIDSLGRVFVQKPSWTLDCLNDKFGKIGNGVLEIIHTDLDEISFDKLYFASGHPTRIRIRDILDGEKLLVECVDIGGIMELDLSQVIEVPALEDLLTYVPPQAVAVYMHGFIGGLLNPSQTKKCLAVLNDTDQVCCGKVVGQMNGIPAMELFIRDDKHKFMMSINENIASIVHDDASTVVDDDESVCGSVSVASIATKASTVSKADTSLSSRGLETPFGRLGIPCKTEDIFNKGTVTFRINDELDIYVTRIASPLNFTVIPVKYLTYLNKLIDEMTVYYSATPLTASYTPRLGECVAAYSGGCWFRVQIDKKLDSDCYSGKFLDQGHMEMFATKCLRVLHDKFLKLPYLAFSGQLHGLKPANGRDWEVDDCIRLKELIHNKKLVSIVRDVISDGERKKLSLEIIDTTTEVDIYVGRQLVLEKRAVPYEVGA